MQSGAAILHPRERSGETEDSIDNAKDPGGPSTAGATRYYLTRMHSETTVSKLFGTNFYMHRSTSLETFGLAFPQAINRRRPSAVIRSNESSIHASSAPDPRSPAPSPPRTSSGPADMVNTTEPPIASDWPADGD